MATKASNSTSKASAAEGVSKEHSAAIAMALHLYFDDVHDIESNVLTINPQTQGIAWNSKIFGLNNNFNR